MLSEEISKPTLSQRAANSMGLFRVARFGVGEGWKSLLKNVPHVRSCMTSVSV